MPRDLIGQILLKQFRVDRYIASGGMATIYQVWDLQRSVSLAMKVLQPELADDPSFITRFQREASSLQQLVHPNIVPFYGLYWSEENTFLLESFIDGPSLDEVMRNRRGKPLPISEAMVFAKALFSSVGYAHAQGIIHCDVKPGNVLIDQGGAVFLTDFGISRYMDSTVTTSAVMGTPLYMAPEQVLGGPVTRQTDIYSLGIVLFELLSGMRPFRGDGNFPQDAGNSQIDRIRYQQVNQPADDLRAYNAQIPEGLSRAVLKALAKDPHERYATVQEMAGEISRAIGARFDTLPDRVYLREDGRQENGEPNNKPSVEFQPPAYIDRAPDGVSSSRPAPSVQITRRLIPLLVVISILSICALAAGGLIRAVGLEIFPKQPQVRTGTAGLPTQTNQVLQTPSSKPTIKAPQPAITAISPEKLGIKGEILIVEHSDGRDQLFLLDLANGNRSALPTVPDAQVDLSQAPQWSHDGSRVVWTSRYAGKTHVVVMDMAEREPYQIPAGEAYQSVSSPTWLPDGKRLSFWATGRNKNWLVIADGTSGESLDQVELPEYRNLFAWNSKNNFLAFVRKRLDSYEVVISSSVASADNPIASNGEAYAPAWSLDGEWLAFQSDAGRVSGENEIWIVRMDGSNLHQITNSPGGTWSRAPTWSPDGRWIAYISNQSGSRGADYGELFAVEVNSGKVVQLTSSNGQVYDWRPAWKPR